MGQFVRGDVVVVPFPFTDLTQTKRRPALVLAEVGLDDYMLCQITSRPWHEPAIKLTRSDFREGGLERDSFARPDHVLTVHEGVIARKVGQIRPEKMKEIREAVRKALD